MNVYQPNTQSILPKQKWIELKEETDSSTIMVGDFNSPFSITDRTTRGKNNKEMKICTTL